MAASGSYPGGWVGETPVPVIDALRAAGCVFAEEEAAILTEAADDPTSLARMLRRRVAGEPLEYIVGWVEFAGRRVGIDSGVFVPRRRSRLLVREALTALRGRADPAVVDLCCGCGAIGLAVASAAPGVRLYAADVDPAAVRCAERNLAAVDGRVFLGDLFDALPRGLRGRVDVLIANAPYVPTAAIPLMPPEAREHESAVALDGGVDGADVLRRVIAGAPGWLRDGGVLLVELGASQILAITAAFIASGLASQIVRDEDLSALAALGSKPSPRGSTTNAHRR